MMRNRIASVVTAGIAALLFTTAASSQVVVSLQTDGTTNELQVVATGLGGPGAFDISAFDLGITFDTSVFNLDATNMNLNLAQLDDLNNLFGNGPGQYAGCALGSNGSTSAGGIGGFCGSMPSGVQADLQYGSFLSDGQLAILQNSGGATSFSLTLATLDFTGTGDLSTVGLVWGDGVHDVKGDASCLDATGAPGVACVIYNPTPTNSVPEPETFGLFGLGLVGTLVTRLLGRRSKG
jgi:hypothetical protein